ncbi:hypothetical protein KM043_012565 [Ampulex compressa]|nr:hypothetical protein KM043_012565 [Ampulex compressa]
MSEPFSPSTDPHNPIRLSPLTVSAVRLPPFTPPPDDPATLAPSSDFGAPLGLGGSRGRKKGTGRGESRLTTEDDVQGSGSDRITHVPYRPFSWPVPGRESELQMPPRSPGPSRRIRTMKPLLPCPPRRGTSRASRALKAPTIDADRSWTLASPDWT